MKKTIFRFWLINVLISIILAILYRIFINEYKPTDTTLFEKFFNILDLMINLGLSAIYLVAIVFSSLSFFLNQIEKIRNNYLLSFLTFSGIPFFCVIFLLVNLMIDFYQYHLILLPIKTLLFFSIAYLLCTVGEFLIFRKKIKFITD